MKKTIPLILVTVLVLFSCASTPPSKDVVSITEGTYEGRDYIKIESSRYPNAYVRVYSLGDMPIQPNYKRVYDNMVYIPDGYEYMDYTVDETYNGSHSVYVTLKYDSLKDRRLREAPTSVPQELKDKIKAAGFADGHALAEWIENTHENTHVLASTMFIKDVTYIDGSPAYLFADPVAEATGGRQGAVCYVVGLPYNPQTFNGYVMDTIYLIDTIGTNTYKVGYQLRECDVYQGTYTTPSELAACRQWLKIIASYGLTHELLYAEFNAFVADAAGVK